jgi:hypothetical protein
MGNISKIDRKVLWSVGVEWIRLTQDREQLAGSCEHGAELP